MQLAFPESFLAVQLSRCALACGARELRLQFRGARAIPFAAFPEREWVWVAVDSNHRPPAYQAGALTD